MNTEACEIVLETPAAHRERAIFADHVDRTVASTMNGEGCIATAGDCFAEDVGRARVQLDHGVNTKRRVDGNAVDNGLVVEHGSEKCDLSVVVLHGRG